VSTHPITYEESMYVRAMGLMEGAAAMLKLKHGGKK